MYSLRWYHRHQSVSVKVTLSNHRLQGTNHNFALVMFVVSGTKGQNEFSFDVRGLVAGRASAALWPRLMVGAPGCPCGTGEERHV